MQGNVTCGWDVCTGLMASLAPVAHIPPSPHPSTPPSVEQAVPLCRPSTQARHTGDDERVDLTVASRVAREARALVFTRSARRRAIYPIPRASPEVVVQML
eukprot:scaffold10708_cov117-Isochrysis_galbana.AAC.3